jgi:hypothetical protein
LVNKMDKNKLQQFIIAARKQGLSDNEINSYVQKKSQLSYTPTPKATSFIENLGSDIASNVSGIAAIPGVLGDILSGKRQLGETAGAVAKGIVEDYSKLSPVARTDTGFRFAPEKTAREFYQKPLSSVLNILPFLGAGKTALSKLGKIGKVAGEVAEDIASTGRIGSVAGSGVAVPSGLDVVKSILKKAERPVAAFDEPSRLSKNIYQSVLSISKKNNAFERLKPSETIGEMIKYKIGGNIDDISEKIAMTTGKRGILSNVVNNAIADTAATIDIRPINRAVSELEGVYSALDKSKIDEVGKRLNKLSPGKKIGTVDASKLLDFERQLQAEATKHRIAGLRGDTAASELADFKTKLANEIGDAIDDVVKKKGDISKYKDPRIVAELNRISPRLAKQFKEAMTISEIRSLQKPFVRMAQIIESSGQEASSLGRNLFRGASQVPVLGNILDVAAQNVAVPLATKTSIALESPAGKAAISGAKDISGRGISSIKSLGKKTIDILERPETYIIGRNIQKAGQQGVTDQLDLSLSGVGLDSQDTESKQYNISDTQMLQVFLNPNISEKTKNNIKKAYDFERSGIGKSGVGKISAKDAALARGGMRSTNEAFRMLKEDPSLLAKSIIPGRPISRKYDAATYNAADSILRLRTGAVATKQEIEATQQRLFPWIGDDKETVAYKIQQLQNIFADYSPQQR